MDTPYGRFRVLSRNNTINTFPTEKVDACILMHDLSRPKTYYLVDELIEHVKRHYGDNIPVMICGNKSDIVMLILLCLENDRVCFLMKRKRIVNT
jgi:hypothetical protein